MLQQEFLDNLEHMARHTKEVVCKKRPTDLLATLVGHRGEDPIVQVTINNFSTREMLAIAHMVANGMECDAIGLVSESYISGVDPVTHEPLMTNPVTGEDWEVDHPRNSLHVVATKHDGLGQGWVMETLMIMCINRANDIAFTTLPFKYVGGKHLHWVENSDDKRLGQWNISSGDDTVATVGIVPNGMRRVMDAASIDQWVSQNPEMAKLFAEVDRDTRDVEMARLISRRGHMPFLFADRGSARAATLSRLGATVRLT